MALIARLLSARGPFKPYEIRAPPLKLPCSSLEREISSGKLVRSGSLVPRSFLARLVSLTGEKGLQLARGQMRATITGIIVI